MGTKKECENTGGKLQEVKTNLESKCSDSMNRGYCTKLPGQSDGEKPSSTLTSPEFTKVKKINVSASKYPCFMKLQEVRSKKRSKVKITANQGIEGDAMAERSRSDDVTGKGTTSFSARVEKTDSVTVTDEGIC